jgi:hypothetical protein
MLVSGDFPMDEKELLAEILTSSQQTNELLSMHLFRLRFSLFALLLLMTLLCVGFGLHAYRQQPQQRAIPTIRMNPPSSATRVLPPASPVPPNNSTLLINPNGEANVEVGVMK